MRLSSKKVESRSGWPVYCMKIDESEMGALAYNDSNRIHIIQVTIAQKTRDKHKPIRNTLNE